MNELERIEERIKMETEKVKSDFDFDAYKGIDPESIPYERKIYRVPLPFDGTFFDEDGNLLTY